MVKTRDVAAQKTRCHAQNFDGMVCCQSKESTTADGMEEDKGVEENEIDEND